METPKKVKCCKSRKQAETVANFEEESTNCKIGILHLPSEILETILGKLTFHEIASVREVCRHFRDECNRILNREFRGLTPRVEEQLVQVSDEFQATVLERQESEETDTEFASVKKQKYLIRCRWFLSIIIVELRNLRAICYRGLYLLNDDISPYHPCSFFAGKILDEIRLILNLVGLRRIRRNEMETDEFFNLVDKFIDFYLDNYEPAMALNRPSLIGSQVVDLLVSSWNCQINVDNFSLGIDSRGRCQLKGECRLPGLLFACLKNDNTLIIDEFDDSKRKKLLQSIHRLSRNNSYVYLTRRHNLEENDLPENKRFWRIPKLCYIHNNGLFVCCNLAYEEDEGDEENGIFFRDLIVRVDMNCPKEYAPLEPLLQWMNISNEAKNSEASRRLMLNLDMKCLEEYYTPFSLRFQWTDTIDEAEDCEPEVSTDEGEDLRLEITYYKRDRFTHT